MKAMFKHLLVPLDGSRLAEAALPAAVYLSQKLGASVTLVHIIERDAPQDVHGQSHLKNVDDARAYLDEVAQAAFPPNLHVERHVHAAESKKDVPCSIVEHTRELGTDLIVMCTHGRGGLRDLLFGSIAQQVVGSGTTPVLLIRPPNIGSIPPFDCRRILAPLDGAPDHEQGLRVGLELAQSCRADLHILVVIPTPGSLLGEHAATRRLLPGTTKEMLELAQQDAEDYLSGHVSRLQNKGVSVTGEVCRGEPSGTIIEAAERIGADLIVLGTHGKVGMGAFWSGSVAPRVSSYSHLPLLLVPVCEQD
jgi:nucleotide-binding universal stress UspA family protein